MITDLFSELVQHHSAAGCGAAGSHPRIAHWLQQISHMSVSSVAISYGKFTSELTFENFCQRFRSKARCRWQPFVRRALVALMESRLLGAVSPVTICRS